MSYTTGRRGPNVSQYLRNLNVQEPSVEETVMTDDELAKDLALFTNTQFYDFETGQSTDYQAPPVKPETATAESELAPEDVTSADSIMGDYSTGLDFAMAGDFNFGDFNSTYTSPTIPSFPDSLGNLQPIQPNPQSAYPSGVPQQHQPGYVHNSSNNMSHSGGVVVGVGVALGNEKKRKYAMAAEHVSPIDNSSSRMLSFEEASRLAAEEDKRKRNTAASARFRIKKKQREQALEKSAKEMTDKVTALESRISALETENKWLKSLVTEKHGGKDDILKKLLKEFSAREGAQQAQAQHAAKEINVRGGSSSAGGSSRSRSTSSSSSSISGGEEAEQHKRARKKD